MRDNKFVIAGITLIVIVLFALDVAMGVWLTTSTVGVK